MARLTKKDMLEGLPSEYMVTESKIVALNTMRYTTSDGTVRVRLHDTDIVVFTTDNMAILNTNGWETPVTKRRMNEVLPSDIFVFQEDYSWYISIHGKTLDYYDSMSFYLR